MENLFGAPKLLSGKRLNVCLLAESVSSTFLVGDKINGTKGTIGRNGPAKLARAHRNLKHRMA